MNISESIVKKSENANNRPETIQVLCKALHDFYKLALIDISKYCSMSAEGKHYKTVHSAYAIMKKELKF